MKKTILVLLMVLLSVMLFVSCKEEKVEEVTYENIIGTWQSGNGEDYAKIIYKDDKKTGSASTSTGTIYFYYYTIVDGVITMKFSETDDTTYAYEAVLQGGKLVLKQKGDRSIFPECEGKTEFTLIKQN